ncbi:hypothetical protein ACFL0T_05980 [Candidatus Omnitrophota bacterium]
MKNNLVIALSVLFIPVLIVSCAPAPSYPREKIVEAAKELCKKEYGVDVELEIIGTTLGVRIPLEGLFDKETLQIVPEAFGKVDGVMLSVSRVALSSDRSIDFYTVITYDKDVPGTEVIMTRYVPDLRRYVYGDISRGEFAKRMIFDVRFNPQGIIDAWLGGFTLEETSLDQFICEQASRRISSEFKENKKLSSKFKIASASMVLENEEFKLTVDIIRDGARISELIHGTTWHEKVLDICLQKISHVIHVYDFKDFKTISAHNKFDNKTKKITKEDINSKLKFLIF